jgi:hypothetical protein
MADIFDQVANDPFYADAVKTLRGMGGGTDPNYEARLAKIMAEIDKANQPKPTVLGETAKSAARGVTGIGKLATRTAQGGALDLGALFGVSPEKNIVS